MTGKSHYCRILIVCYDLLEARFVDDDSFFFVCLFFDHIKQSVQ